MIKVFLQSLIIGYSGAMAPGALLTYTIDKSIKTGAKAGLLISIGHSILEFVLVILLLVGIGKHLQTPLAQMIISGLGGLVLCYFGASMLKDVYKNKLNVDFNSQQSSNTSNMLLNGAVISASNPYFIIWWTVVGLGMIMSAYSAFGLKGVIVFYIGHILADISWYYAVSLLISKTRRFINLKAYKWVIAVLGICLIGFGLSFIANGTKLYFKA